MSTAGKMKRRVGVKMRNRGLCTTNDPEWKSFDAIARKVDQGWRYFWRNRGIVMAEQGVGDFDFRATPYKPAKRKHSPGTTPETRRDVCSVRAAG